MTIDDVIKEIQAHKEDLKQENHALYMAGKENTEVEVFSRNAGKIAAYGHIEILLKGLEEGK